MTDDFITASAVAEYLYCQRAWWYRRRGVINANVAVLAEGTEQHEALAEAVRRSEIQRRTARLLLGVGLALLLIFLILRAVGGL